MTKRLFPPTLAGNVVAGQPASITGRDPFHGPLATECRLLLRSRGHRDVAKQAERIYSELASKLFELGVPTSSVISELVFFRDIERGLAPFMAGRHRALAEVSELWCYAPAKSHIEQPPLTGEHDVEVLVTVLAPRDERSRRAWTFQRRAVCQCVPCGSVEAKFVPIDGEMHVAAGNIVGVPGASYDETFSMFEAAREILACEKGDFRSVVRTWIHFRDIDRDYAEFNRARSDFFAEAEVITPPASTGIGGAPFVSDHAVCMSFEAILPAPRAVRRMRAPTLNEASEYGSSFSRGLRVVDANKTSILVSGTASIEEGGKTAYPGEIDAQVERMLLNIDTLLVNQDASFRDVMSGITYVKRREDAERVLEILDAHGLTGFANPVVLADVCRPDLLCEMEVTAVLPVTKEIET